MIQQQLQSSNEVEEVKLRISIEDLSKLKNFTFLFFLKMINIYVISDECIKMIAYCNTGIIFLLKKGSQNTMSESSYSVEEQSNISIKRPYNKVTLQKKEELFKEVFENKMKITKAARKIDLNISTAKFLIKQFRKANNIFKKGKDSSSCKIQQNSNSTDQENQPRESSNNGGFLPFYYPFYPQGFCHMMAGDGQILYTPFFQS